MSVEEFKIADHVVKFDPERRVLLYQYQGSVLPEHAHELIQLSNKILDRYPGLYAVIDAASLKAMPPDSRKLSIAWFKERRVPAIVCFGTDLTTRTLATLVTSAARLLGGPMPRYIFVNSEKDAYAWVARQPLTETTK